LHLYLKEAKSILTIEELALKLGVNEKTVKRDLNKLKKNEIIWPYKYSVFRRPYRDRNGLESLKTLKYKVFRGAL